MTARPAVRPHPTASAQPAGGAHGEGLAVVRDPGPRQLLFTWERSELQLNYDPFLLRGMAWCRLCEVPMAPSWQAGPDRTYRCTPHCRPVMACDLEAAVVDAAKGRVPEFDHLSPLVHASALEHLLDRVVVGQNLNRPTFRWHTEAPSPVDAAG